MIYIITIIAIWLAFNQFMATRKPNSEGIKPFILDWEIPQNLYWNKFLFCCSSGQFTSIDFYEFQICFNSLTKALIILHIEYIDLYSITIFNIAFAYKPNN